MAKQATKASQQFLIKVGYRYLNKEKQLVEKRQALPFPSRSAALQHATAVFNDGNEHKYKIVPKG